MVFTKALRFCRFIDGLVPMKAFVRNTALLILLLFAQCLLAQKEFHFENFNIRNGLSSNEIRVVLRDKQGFLWVGTGNGLNRFDGRNFKVYLPNPKLKNTLRGAAVTGLGEDLKGRIWVANSKGIDVYNPITDDFSEFKLQHGSAVDYGFRNGCHMTFDRKGRAVITSAHHKIIIVEPDGQQRVLETPEVPIEHRPSVLRKQKGNKVFVSILKSDEEVWLSSDHGIFSLRLTDDHFTYHPLKGCKWLFGPGSLYYDAARERIWMSSFGNSFLYLEVKTGKWGQLSNDIKVKDYISGGQCIAPFGKDYIFLNAPGLYNQRTEVFTPTTHIPDDPFTFPLGNPLCTYTDFEGILWIGTTTGLVKLDPSLQGFKHHLLTAHPTFDYDNSVFDVFYEPQNQKLYATSFYVGGIYEYDPRTQKSVDLTANSKQKLAGTCKILRDSKGKTWVTANGTLYEADLVNRRFKPARSAPPPKGVWLEPVVPDMEEDADGNIWLAKWGVGPLFYDRKADLLSYLEGDNFRDDPNVAYMLCSDRSKQHIWMCTVGNGLFKYDIKTRRAETITQIVDQHGDTINIKDSNGIECDYKDRVWIATRQGLIMLTSKSRGVVFTESDGLANSQVEGMGKDQKGRMWIATASGISMVDPRTFEIRNFDERQGMKTDATLDCFSLLPSGELCSGTKKGFIQFHPDTILKKSPVSKPIITDLWINGRRLATPGKLTQNLHKLTLKPFQNFINIEFTSLTFTLPEEIQYSYYLEGRDKEWSIPGKSQLVNYSDLLPGPYKFCLKAKNKDGNWSKDITTLALIIKPPFWRTPWFIALINLAIGGLIYAAYRFRTWQIRKEERMKTEFNKRLAEVEMAALRSQMNPHFLFNCLNSINRFIQRNEPDAASAYLTKFSRLIRLVLDNSRSNMVTLRDELEALKLYIELESMRFVNRFTYQVQIAPELDTTAVEVPPMIIQPYVENAIWHGLMHKEAKPAEECYLEVRVFPEANALVVEIEDNGVGRATSRLLKSKSATAHKSHGMEVTAERIQMINEIYQTETSIVIEDLVSADGKAAGTKVRLTLPLE